MKDLWREGTEREPCCPVCGRVCDTIYRERYFEIVGCENCVSQHEACETEACYEPRYAVLGL